MTTISDSTSLRSPSKELGENASETVRNANRLVAHTIRSLRIPHISQRNRESAKSELETYFQKLGEEFYLIIYSVPGPIPFSFQISLTEVACNIWEEMYCLFSNGRAKKLFSVQTEDYSGVLFEESAGFLRFYLLHLPNVLYHSNHQAFAESIVGYVKKFVEPELRERQKLEAIDSKINLIEDNDIRSLIRKFPGAELHFLNLLDVVDRSFGEYRRNTVRNRRAWLTPAKLRGELANEYDDLRALYTQAKQALKTLEKEHLQAHRNAIVYRIFEPECKVLLDREFPTLTEASVIRSSEPSKLAYAHLARLYDAGEDYIVKKVVASRKLRRNEKSMDKNF